MLNYANIYKVVGFVCPLKNFTSPPCRGILERRALLSEI